MRRDSPGANFLVTLQEVKNITIDSNKKKQAVYFNFKSRGICNNQAKVIIF
jgi:hypothetical protein